MITRNLNKSLNLFNSYKNKLVPNSFSGMTTTTTTTVGTYSNFYNKNQAVLIISNKDIELYSGSSGSCSNNKSLLFDIKSNSSIKNYYCSKSNNNSSLDLILDKIDKYPNHPVNFYNLVNELESLKIQNEPITLLNGNKLMIKDLLAKELENNPTGYFYGFSEFEKYFKCFIIFKLLCYLIGFKKETVIIDNKEFDALNVALLFLEQDNDSIKQLDKIEIFSKNAYQHSMAYVQEYLYVTGNPSITLSNGTIIDKNPIYIDKYNNFVDYISSPFSGMINIFEYKFQVDAAKHIINNINCDPFISYYHFNKAIDYKNSEYCESSLDDKKEIELELFKKLPNITFGHWLVIKLNYPSISHTKKYLVNNTLYDKIEMLVMDIENIHKNNHLEEYDDEQEFQIMYSNILNLLTILMDGYNSTVVINGESFTKLDLILKCWEYSNNIDYPGCKDGAEKQIISYLCQTGQSSINTPTGKTLNFNLDYQILEIN